MEEGRRGRVVHGGVRMRLRSLVVLVAASTVASARASPNLPSDDPAWDALRDSIAAGAPDLLGGVQWLSRSRVLGVLPPPDGFWFEPVDRVALRFTGADEHDRPYSLPLRPRQIAGSIAVSCEYQEGRPCGDGLGAGFEVDLAAGFSDLLTAYSRLRAFGGTDQVASELAIDRAYVKFEAGPFLLQAGRDVLALGPSVRFGLLVSRNAAPQDGIWAQLHPITLPFLPSVRFSIFYFIDRLRDPQRFSGTLLDCTRAQFDFGERVQLGGSRMLELGGEGAPDYGGFSGFILEHFGRTQGSAAENNRLSLDLTVRVPEWSGARLYYEIAFEDTRQAFWNSVRYDADHLLGLEMRGLHIGPLRRLFVELEHTGWVSQEHGVFTAGMTNDGHTFGSALGPDGTSIWARADLELGPVVLSPWAEWMRFISDRYDSDQARGVFVVATGPNEHRQRLGADAQVMLTRSLVLTGGVFGERIGNADLVIESTRYSGGMRAALIWRPP